MPKQNVVRAKRLRARFGIRGRAPEFYPSHGGRSEAAAAGKLLVTNGYPRRCKNLSLFRKMQVMITLSGAGRESREKSPT
jgi:hypothetical protein